jgi:hypothetical protein
METWNHGDMDMEKSNEKRKTEEQAIFPCLFTITSKRKSVVSPFVDEEQTVVIRLQTY